MAQLRVVLEVDHAPDCRAEGWREQGTASDWIASTWVIRDTSEFWLAVSCNDPLCLAAGLISQESILEHARTGLAKATAERPWTPNAVEERDRLREEKRLAAGGAPRVEVLDVTDELGGNPEPEPEPDDAEPELQEVST